MKPIDDKKDTVTINAVTHDEEGRKRVVKTELPTHSVDTIRYIEKKLVDKGLQRLERHPRNGTGIGQPPPKSGHGGKYTWEGPGDVIEYEMDPVPPAIDERDPNYVDEEAEKRVADDGVAELVAGEVEVEVAKAAEDRAGVSRVEVVPPPHHRQHKT